MSRFHNHIVPAAEVVLIGGGHCHVEVIRRYAELNPRPYRLTLISETTMAAYSGMLAGFIAGHYEYPDIHIDLGHLCARSDVRLIGARVSSIDLPAKSIILSEQRRIPYDGLSFDIGASIPERPDTSRVIPVKPIHKFIDRLEKLDQQIAESTLEKPYRLAIVGAGPSGVELALAFAFRYGKSAHTLGKVRIRLIEEKSSLLSSSPARVRMVALRALRQSQVQLSTGVKVSDLASGQLATNNGEPLLADGVIITAGTRGADWLKNVGLDLDEHGFIRVRDTLETMSHEAIYAAGDTCSLDSDPHLPKNGVHAVRMGPVLAHNLNMRFRGGEPMRFHPQTNVLSLISLGSKAAVAQRGMFSWKGPLTWSLKDFIDRQWMRRYQVPPQEVRIPTYIESGNLAEKPCSASGSKIPADSFELMPRLRPLSSEVVSSAADREDASMIALRHWIDGKESPASPPFLCQSLDYIRAFSPNLFVVARIAVAHALNDLFAMGCAPHSAHALATVRFGPKAAMRRDFQDLMAGVSVSLDADGVHLLGGHSQSGWEAGVGLMVQGLATHPKAWHKGALRAGDRLILTKPIGTGILLAGHQRYRVPSRHLETAFAMMMKSHRPLLEICHKYGVMAATDVGGFGLGWNLEEMCRMSGLGATLELTSVPIYSGVFRALSDGVRSSLHSQNRLAFTKSLHGLFDRELLLAESLFDPQTAGGLLIAVSEEKAHALLQEIRAAGMQKAAIIGHTHPTADQQPRLILDA